ncbi:MAG: hypothetical protein WAM79_16885 [Candidatus Sulfotelmatobacter sp.]
MAELLFIFLLLSLIVHLSIMAEIFGAAAVPFFLADLAYDRGFKNSRHLKVRQPFV